ncbi:unnamed protein product [Linum trigynum]|uniref:Glycosyltransferase N-terminal domain-containing protein n=1 Tax=Linum trigynum TaxID=586398 RepID=A0AAV2D314_9ROSI
MGSEDHIVMLPFMAHGHLIPFLALAKQIRGRTGFIVTIATTGLNAQYLRSSLASSHSDNDTIRLVELPFSGADHGLPPGAENSENLPLDLIVNLFHASTALQTPTHDLVSKITAEQGGRPPLCIVSDVFFGWANDVAEATGTRNFTFSTGGAYGTLAYVSIWTNLPHRNLTDSGEFAVPGFPDNRRFHITQLHQFLRKADGEDPWSKFFQPQISKSLEKSYGWLCNSVDEIEPLGFELLGKYSNRQIWGIGPLLPPEILRKSGTTTKVRRQSGKTPGVSAEKCIEWLESHEPGSVLYISFGSQNSINPQQMMELAAGLEEQSAVSFLWVIRPPIGFDRRS